MYFNTIYNTNNINVKVTDVSALETWASSNPAQGTHAWIAVDINTGVSDITKLTYNGSPLTQADVDEAAERFSVFNRSDEKHLG